jgi:hypothetical protein
MVGVSIRSAAKRKVWHRIFEQTDNFFYVMANKDVKRENCISLNPLEPIKEIEKKFMRGSKVGREV